LVIFKVITVNWYMLFFRHKINIRI